MTNLPPDDSGERQRAATRRFWFNLTALLVGASLLVIGGKNSDTITQTAGGAIFAAAAGVIGWHSRPKDTP